jgi:hypothetical protein
VLYFAPEAKQEKLTHHLQSHDTGIRDVDGALHVGAVWLVHGQNLEVEDIEALQ